MEDGIRQTGDGRREKANLMGLPESGTAENGGSYTLEGGGSLLVISEEMQSLASEML
jgi:hypothetical protein